MTINLARLLNRLKRFICYCCDLFFADIESFVNSVNRKSADIFFILLDKGFNISFVGLFTDIVGYIEGKKIAVFDELIYIIQSDMVGIHQIRSVPSIGRYCIVGLFARICMARSYDSMFSV